MNMFCNNCGKSSPCGCGCSPAKYGCDFDINANPYDPSIWNVTINGATTRVKLPKIAETDTKLSTSYTKASLNFDAERHTDIVTGAQLGSLIKMEDLRDVDAKDADSCDILVYHPYCSECGDGCTPKNAQWEKYHIPDAGDTTIPVDDDGYYRVLTKSDCGCIKEDRLPVVPAGMIAINYVRDSVPDDPDFPWYYGCYNDTINLYLAQNAKEYFGKYALEVTVNYGIQVVKSDATPNYNFRSLLVPVIANNEVDVTREASILQTNATVSTGTPSIPWGTQSLRGSFTFVVPKGKEASLHHEFRIRTNASFPKYATNALDGQRVPDDIAGQVDKLPWAGSRLNALQVIVRPTNGSANYTPVVDAERDKLDAPVDAYDNIG